MNEDTLNMSVRKFLKQVGITAQREMEAAVRRALAEGTLPRNGSLQARAIITLAKTDLNVVVEDDIRFE